MKQILWVGTVLAWVGCASDSKSTVQVFVDAEETIPEGLTPGEDVENVRDGWRIQYTKFLVTLGRFVAYKSNETSTRIESDTTALIDMQNLGPSFVYESFENVEPGRYDKVGYGMYKASDASQQTSTITDANAKLMKDNAYALYIEGEMTKADGQACEPNTTANCVPMSKLTFAWGLSYQVTWRECSPASGDAGFAVADGGSTQVQTTLHGDHWFFNNFPAGVEQTQRLGQWVVDRDSNRDGITTVDELRLSTPPAPPTYNMAGAPIPVKSGLDYVFAQAATLGHLQSDGECPVIELSFE